MKPRNENVVPQLLKEIKIEQRREEFIAKWGNLILKSVLAAILIGGMYWLIVAK